MQPPVEARDKEEEALSGEVGVHSRGGQEALHQLEQTIDELLRVHVPAIPAAALTAGFKLSGAPASAPHNLCDSVAIVAP